MEAFKDGISVVIPCYNSSKTLEELHQRLTTVLEGISVEYEIILVNDGSRDGTWGKISEISKADGRVRGVNLMRNYGQHNALLCGIRMARRELILTLDDDLQHPPEEIPKLLGSMKEDIDMVYGCAREQVHNIFRNLASLSIKTVLAMVTGNKLATRVSAFRVFRTALRKAFEGYNSQYVSIDVLLSWGTKKISFTEVCHSERKEGRSTYTLGKLISHAFDMLTGFSAIPLRLANLTGFMFTLFGMVVLAYVLIRFLIEGGSIPGFPFLASIITIFAGAQLFAIGIIGEYIARIHFRSMNHPAYSVKEECGTGEGGEADDV